MIENVILGLVVVVVIGVTLFQLLDRRQRPQGGGAHPQQGEQQHLAPGEAELKAAQERRMQDFRELRVEEEEDIAEAYRQAAADMRMARIARLRGRFHQPQNRQPHQEREAVQERHPGQQGGRQAGDGAEVPPPHTPVNLR